MRLRTQLVALLVGIVALVVLITSLAATAALRSYLVDRVDDQLRASLLRTGDGRPGGLPGHHRSRPDVGVLTLEYDASGALRPAAAARLALTGGPAVADPREHLRSPAVVDDTEDDRRWRVLARADADVTVLAAVPFDGVEDTVRRLLVISAAVGLVALSAGAVLAWVAVRRSLRPLLQVESTAQAIAAGDLSVRVPSADPRTEVGSLAASFNVMVDRFESAYGAQQRSEAEARASEARMRRFVGDASHELRTPLTSIRGFAELFRQGAADDPEQLATVMRRIEDEAARMGLLVEDLLLLARLDQARPLRAEPVDLLSVANDVVQAANAVHPQSPVRLRPVTGTVPPVVLGDDGRLHQVLSNLVTNALSHSPAGTSVEVRVGVEAEQVVVEVEDDGEGMTPEVAARVFERFYRADSSRTRTATATGSGLGLSIVAALVAAHGGEVDVTSEPGRGSCFTVRLPTAGRRG